MTNTKVTFNVQTNLLRDYLGYLFAKSSDREYIITARSDFGKLLIAHLQPADRLPLFKPTERSATLVIPTNEATINFSNKFVCYSSQSTIQLNFALTAIFNLDFWQYSIECKAMGLRNDEMIESFIFSRKLLSGEFFESLKKRAYRKDVETLKLLTTKLKRRYYNINNFYRKKIISENGSKQYQKR